MVLEPAVLIRRHRVSILVLIILVKSMRIRDDRSQVCTVTDIEGMPDSKKREITLIISILVSLGIKISRIQFAADKIDMTQSPHPEKRETTQLALTRGQVEDPILVTGNGFRPYIDTELIGYLCKRISIAYKIRRALIFIIQRSFHSRFETAEKIQLQGLLMPAAIAAPQIDIEHRGQRIPIFGRESPGEKVGGLKRIGIERANRSTRSPKRAKMIRVRGRNAFDPPQNARGRITSDDNIIPGIAVRNDPGIITDQLGRIIPAAGIPRHLVRIKGPGAPCSELIDRRPLFGGRRHDGDGLQTDQLLLQRDVQDHLLTRSHEHLRDDRRLVANTSIGELLPAQRDSRQHISP